MQRIRSVFNSDPTMRQLGDTVGRLQQLQSLWLKCVPMGLEAHTHVIQLEHRQLTLACANGAVAAKIHLLKQPLIQALQAQSVEVTAIYCQVQAIPAAKPVKKVSRTLSKQALGELEALENRLEDTPLKARLADMLARTRS